MVIDMTFHLEVEGLIPISTIVVLKKKKNLKSYYTLKAEIPNLKIIITQININN